MPVVTDPRLLLATSAATARAAALTVAAARAVLPGLAVHVLDLDGTFDPAVPALPAALRTDPGTDLPAAPRAEGRHDLPPDVRDAAGWGVPVGRLHALALRHGGAGAARALLPDLVAAVGREVPAGTPLLVLAPGVLPLRRPDALLAGLSDADLALVPRAPAHPGDGAGASVPGRGWWHPGALALRAPGTSVVAWWRTATPDDDRWLDALAAAVPHAAVREPAAVLSAWSGAPTSGLAVAGRPVELLDLSGLDPVRPRLLDARPGVPQRRLDDERDLAALVAAVARSLRDAPAPVVPADAFDPARTALGVPVDDLLRDALVALGAPPEEAAPGSGPGTHPTTPGGAGDPYDPRTADDLLGRLTAPGPAGAPAPVLAALLARRPDLRRAFPRVPGADTPRFLAWTREHAVADGAPAALVEPALRRAAAAPPPPPAPAGAPEPGVTVVGFLRGELGLGESARGLVAALDAVGVPHAALTVGDDLVRSRQRAVRTAGRAERDAEAVTFDTTVVCVNADLTPTVVASLPPRLRDRSLRVGMWYWEVEDFPADQHGGFAAVDEVWVATDFVRAAIAPHSPVPVVTLTPPLPQRGPAPVVPPRDLGVPDRPYVLFAFDHLSTLDRKNPLGLVDAFTAAVTPDDGPVLVLKTINAEHRPQDAERLRRRVVDLEHVVLLEDYLDAAERDALVAGCAAYASLHRSEGLGLTMAEAMAWGRPVVATGYSGNLQFMTEENSWLVPCSPGTIPAGAAPYPAGGRWAEPDLDAAAAALRAVLDDPAAAAVRGRRAASDIRERHSPAVAGRAIAAHLEEVAGRRRARARGDLRFRLRQVRGAAGAAARRTGLVR
ncbi:glycosyltransferase [Cellulomonas marina]|uniref:Glycosyl transferases group 1 n=1 Tax=Cellulomonas marina TaxID=988821 RepID=A0A1I0UYJ3_9CELL|nr:glycosyltransferase [Cellulomonas marina]GIG29921.1 hypothetical protein Cma02nite_25210 [Cellulomonas marina]SFA69115.1 Glycosyl transferases group 1 [Cellulomonas marina]